VPEVAFHDKVVDEMLRRNNKVKAALHKKFARTKPFRGEEISNDELLFYYEGLDQMGMQTLLQTHGEEAVSELIRKMETMKMERQNGRN